MKPTVRNIAKKAGVSIASVSLVLNDKPSRITDATKIKILQAAEELGYDFVQKEKEKQEKALINNIISMKSKNMLAVIYPRFYDELLEFYQCGIEKYAHIQGYKIINAHVNDSTEQALQYLELFSEIGVSGIILVPPSDMNEKGNNDKLGEALKKTELPFVLLGEAIDRVYCDFVTVDNKDGAYMATEYLIHNGHRNIGMIAGKREVYTCRKKVEGYKEALAFYDISIKEENVFYGQCQWKTGYEAMKYFENLGIFSVVVSDDEIAMGVYQYAKEHCKAIGEDISIVSFNNSKAVAFLQPALTGILQPGELMGKKACEVVIKRIVDRKKEKVRTSYFAPSLVERESVKNNV